MQFDMTVYVERWGDFTAFYVETFSAENDARAFIQYELHNYTTGPSVERVGSFVYIDGELPEDWEELPRDTLMYSLVSASYVQDETYLYKENKYRLELRFALDSNVWSVWTNKDDEDDYLATSSDGPVINVPAFVDEVVYLGCELLYKELPGVFYASANAVYSLEDMANSYGWL